MRCYGPYDLDGRVREESHSPEEPPEHSSVQYSRRLSGSKNSFPTSYLREKADISHIYIHKVLHNTQADRGDSPSRVFVIISFLRLALSESLGHLPGAFHG